MTAKRTVLLTLLLLLPACAPGRAPQPDTTTVAAKPAAGAQPKAATAPEAQKPAANAKAAPSSRGAEAALGAMTVERVAREMAIPDASAGEMAAESAAAARLRRAFALPPGSPARAAALDSIRRDLGLDFAGALANFARRTSEPARARAQALLALGEQDPRGLDPFDEALGDTAAVVRAAAAAALGRTFQPIQHLSTEEVERLLGRALRDRAAEVQAAALQSLSDRDAPLLRTYLARHPRQDLAVVARQLLTLAEERGAALVPDAKGVLTLETAGGVTLRYTPTRRFPAIGASEGVLTAAPRGKPAVRLADGVEVVGDVLPAVVSSDGRYVAYEAARVIHVRDLERGGARALGPGIAPRPEPFGGGFIFLRQQTEMALPRGNTEITYQVLAASFTPGRGGGQPRALGMVAARPSMTLHGNYAPVRWMRVVETAGHFTLEAEGMRAFSLPDPFGASAP